MLLGHLLGQSAAWLEAHRDAVLADPDVAALTGLVARRAAGEPIAYILGRREFYGRDFAVTPAVLIPRPETELLVERAKQKVDGDATARLLDLGTGSGCLAISLALELPRARITAVDIAAAALAVARSNAARLGASVSFQQSDWYAALPRARFDLIVANPPYIAAGDRHLGEGDLRYEPPGALTDHADGLAALRHIIGEAPAWLSSGGWLFVEHGYDQSAAVLGLLVEAGFVEIEQRRDLAGILRTSGGKIPD